MTIVLGVDGCPGGWCCVAVDPDRTSVVEAFLARNFSRVLDSPATVICVDIPIGLLDGPGQRSCDVEARRLLPMGRGPSVFPPPCRRSLAFDDYETASGVNFELSGRYLNKQSFNISPKVREVDEAMKPGMQERVREVHPELCFQALNRGMAMRLNKKIVAGRQERWRLLRGVLTDLRANPLLPSGLRPGCGPDDYVDALVCAWTAASVARGDARSIPAEPEYDARGLRMEMWLPQ